MPTIAVFNQKAGVGKTSTAINLLAGIARRGTRSPLPGSSTESGGGE